MIAVQRKIKVYYLHLLGSYKLLILCQLQHYVKLLINFFNNFPSESNLNKKIKFPKINTSLLKNTDLKKKKTWKYMLSTSKYIWLKNLTLKVHWLPLLMVKKKTNFEIFLEWRKGSIMPGSRWRVRNNART